MNRQIEVWLKGALLLGAGRSREIHDATLRRPGGEPYIPASALKGAIREQLVRLEGEEVARRILGGEGYRQELGAQAEPSESIPPPVEERPGGGSTRVYLTDAELDSKVAKAFRGGLGYTVRAQVSIDRRGRRAADQRLFQRQVLGSPGEGVTFRAPVDLSLLGAGDRSRFEAAVRAVFALGSSRSRGLGWVDLDLVAAERSKQSPRPIEIPETEELEVVFEALEPLSLGKLPFVGNFQPTLDFLTASTVRGAVVTAALRHRGVTEDLRGDPDFDRLILDPDTCVRFGDAMPVDGGSEARPGIAPLTARVGKYGGEDAAVNDTLVRAYVQQVAAERGIFRPVRDEVVDDRGGTERAARPGRWLGAVAPERRVMTRLALERDSARGRDGALYSVELLERGTRFVATVSNAGPEARRLLADAAAVDLRAGHGRGQGYGRMRIVEVREREAGPLRGRLDAFDEHVRSKIAAAVGQPENEPPTDVEGRYLAALLVTEMIPGEPPPESVEDTFHAALDLRGSRLLHAAVRAGQRGGFDTAAACPRPFVPVVRAGSVLLLSVPAFDAETLDRLAALERHGVGEDRDRGFGAVRFSDPIHLQGVSP